MQCANSTHIFKLKSGINVNLPNRIPESSLLPICGMRKKVSQNITPSPLYSSSLFWINGGLCANLIKYYKWIWRNNRLVMIFYWNFTKYSDPFIWKCQAKTKNLSIWNISICKPSVYLEAKIYYNSIFLRVIPFILVLEPISIFNEIFHLFFFLV